MDIDVILRANLSDSQIEALARALSKMASQPARERSIEQSLAVE